MSLCNKNVFLVTQSRNSVRELVGFDWRSPRIHYCVLPSEHACECTCVLEVGPVLWQRPGQTAGSSPCSRAQCSLSQQALVTSKNWRKGKHSARVPPSASLRVLSETQAQKPKRTQMSTHEVSFTPTKNICLPSVAQGISKDRSIENNCDTSVLPKVIQFEVYWFLLSLSELATFRKY